MMSTPKTLLVALAFLPLLFTACSQSDESASGSDTSYSGSDPRPIPHDDPTDVTWDRPARPEPTTEGETGGTDDVSTTDNGNDNMSDAVDVEGDAVCVDTDGDGRGVGCPDGPDCDDGDRFSYPEALQICDGNDNACLQEIPTDELDGDGDGYVGCAGWTDPQGDNPDILGGGDCDDENASIYPGTEGCMGGFFYHESFDESDGGWIPSGTVSSWEWGVPVGEFISEAATGSNAWVTNLDGEYLNNELSYLQSPVFDFSELGNDAVVRFFHIRNTEACCDGAWLETSIDGGETWTVVGEGGVGYNWYNDTLDEQWNGDSEGWLLSEHTLDDTAGFSNVFMRVGFQSDSMFNHEGFGIDEVDVFGGVVDLAVTAIDAHPAGCGFSEENPVAIIVDNFGTEPVTTFSVRLAVDDVLVAEEVIAEWIPSGMATEYVFEATADLSGLGHTVAVTVVADLDAFPSNDTLEVSTDEIPGFTGLPYYEGFETSDGGWTAYGMVSSWARGIPSGSVIRDAAGGEYAWVTNPSGTYNNSEFSYLESPCLDFLDLEEDPLIRFQHNYETESCCDEGWMEMSVDGGIVWTKVLADPTAVNWYNDTTYQWWDDSSGGWRDARVQLEGAAGEGDVRLRFVFSTDSSVVRDGFAVDDVMIVSESIVDVAVTEVYLDSLACRYTDSEQVVARIANQGTGALSAIEVTLEVGDTEVATESIVGPIESGASVLHSFAAMVDLSEPGTHTITVTAEIAGDIAPGNDQGSTTIENLGDRTVLPYSEDFETSDGGWTTYGSLTSWEHGHPAGIDIDVAAGGENAWVTNLDGDYRNYEYSYVESPCLDFSTATEDPYFFFEHIYETELCCDEGWLEVSTNGGETWTKVLDDGTAENWYNDTYSQWWDGVRDDWHNARVRLTGTAGLGDVRLRFTLSTDGSVLREGFGFDDLLITGSDFFDAALSDLHLSQDECVYEAGETVVVTVENNGTADLTDLQLRLELDETEIAVETVPGTILPGAETEYPFTASLDLSARELVEITVSVLLVDDAREGDNQATIEIDNRYGITSLPYTTGFEADDGGWQGYGTYSSWAWGAPAGTIISTAASGANAWVTNLSGNYNTSERSYLESPCMDLQDVAADPVIYFQHNFSTEPCCDEGWLEISTNGGVLWTKLVDDGSAINWYNDTFYQWWEGSSSGWRMARARLSGAATRSDVRVRYAFSADSVTVYEGFAVDDINITDDDTVDVEAINVRVEPTTCRYGSEDIVVFKIANAGAVEVSEMLLRLVVDSTTVAEELVSHVLAPGASFAHQFTATADVSTVGAHVVSGVVVVTGDLYPGNDQANATIDNRSDELALPYLEDFETSNGRWTTYGTMSSWNRAVPNGTIIDDTPSGNYAWITNASGEYSLNEMSYLESPCFDFSTLESAPILSFRQIYDTETCCDQGWMEISLDGGNAWTKLLGGETAVNWYNDTENHWWNGLSDDWQTVQVSLDGADSFDEVRVRFAFSSDGSLSKEGFAVDRIQLEAPAPE